MKELVFFDVCEECDDRFGMVDGVPSFLGEHETSRRKLGLVRLPYGGVGGERERREWILRRFREELGVNAMAGRFVEWFSIRDCRVAWLMEYLGSDRFQGVEAVGVEDVLLLFERAGWTERME